MVVFEHDTIESLIAASCLHVYAWDLADILRYSEVVMFGQVTVYIVDDEDDVQLRASSSSVKFPGFLDVYKVRSSP